jgi:hypothetical protein
MPYAQGLPFARDSHTSYKSAVEQSCNPQRGAKLLILLIAYRNAGDHGLTDHEAATRCNLPVQSITSLRNALMEDGVVGKAGERVGPYGKANTVHIYIGSGLE